MVPYNPTEKLADSLRTINQAMKDVEHARDLVQNTIGLDMETVNFPLENPEERQAVGYFQFRFSTLFQDFDEGLTESLYRVEEGKKVSLRKRIQELQGLDILEDEFELQKMIETRKISIHHQYLTDRTLQEKKDLLQFALNEGYEQLTRAVESIQTYVDDEIDPGNGIDFEP